MTNLSTEQIVGQNGQSYHENGSNGLGSNSQLQLSHWQSFLPKYFKYGINTVSDFIEIRYDTVTKRIISILFIVTYMISFYQ